MPLQQTLYAVRGTRDGSSDKGRTEALVYLLQVEHPVHQPAKE